MKSKEEVKFEEVVEIIGEEEITDTDMMFGACPASARCGGSGNGGQ